MADENISSITEQALQAYSNFSKANTTMANTNLTVPNQYTETGSNDTVASVNGSNSSVLLSGVGYPPQADPGINQEVNQGQWVTLNGRDSYDPDGGNLTYTWSQVSGKEVALEDDDQAQAHFRAPSVSQDSVLKFTLLVEDENGDIGKNSVYVTVKGSDKPHADAGGDQTVDEGEWVTLDGGDSYDPDGNSLDYSWTQTSGEKVDLQNDDESSAHFWAPNVYDDETLKFTLRVGDTNGNSDESSVSVKVQNNIDSNSKPHADAGGDQTVDEGEWVTLDGGDSYDPDGNSLDYSWTQTSGENVDLQNDDESTASFRAPQVSEDTTLRFSLIVDDDQGRSDEDSVIVNVNSFDSSPDQLPCVQTYDTPNGKYVTDCENNGGGGNHGNNGNICKPGSPPPCPLVPICKPGSPPPCPPVPICKPGSAPPCPPANNNPVCKPGSPPPCVPGNNNPVCKPGSPPPCGPSTQPIKPGTQPKIVSKPIKQNTQPKKIQPKQVHTSSIPQIKPPKQPTQKFKPPKTTTSSSKRR